MIPAAIISIIPIPCPFPRRALLILLVGVALSTCGCANFYSHRISTQDYTLYGDESLQQLQTTGDQLTRVIHAYRELFPSHAADIPRPRVIYSEDSLVQRRIYTADLHQEGYYLPLFRLIGLTPRLPPEERRDGQTVILHELAHHFLISAYPETGDVYWLNEGIACMLELGFFDEHGKLVLPGYHPWLHLQAQQALSNQGPAGLRAELHELLDSSWFRFHHGRHKTRNYALSWALTYRLMEGVRGDLETRIESVLALSDAHIERELERLPDWLAGDPQQELQRLAHDERLRLWALDRWLDMKRVDARALRPHLMPLLESETPRLRRAGYQLLVRLLASHPRGFPSHARRHCRRLIALALEHGGCEEVLGICRALGRGSRHPVFLAPLVTLLESQDPDVRLAAARALARLSLKPTVTRPAFWRADDAAASRSRQHEIAEWQHWLHQHQSEWAHELGPGRSD